MIKTPWDAALETGSPNNAFEEITTKSTFPHSIGTANDYGFQPPAQLYGSSVGESAGGGLNDNQVSKCNMQCNVMECNVQFAMDGINIKCFFLTNTFIDI